LPFNNQRKRPESRARARTYPAHLEALPAQQQKPSPYLCRSPVIAAGPGPAAVRGVRHAVGAGRSRGLAALQQGVGLRSLGRHLRLDLRPRLCLCLHPVLLFYPRLHLRLLPQHPLLLAGWLDGISVHGSCCCVLVGG